MFCYNDCVNIGFKFKTTIVFLFLQTVENLQLYVKVCQLCFANFTIFY